MQKVLGSLTDEKKALELSRAFAGGVIFWSAGSRRSCEASGGVSPCSSPGLVALDERARYLTQVSVNGTYLGELAAGLLLVGVRPRTSPSWPILDRCARRGPASRGRAPNFRSVQHDTADRRRAGIAGLSRSRRRLDLAALAEEELRCRRRSSGFHLRLVVGCCRPSRLVRHRRGTDAHKARRARGGSGGGWNAVLDLAE